MLFSYNKKKFAWFCMVFQPKLEKKKESKKKGSLFLDESGELIQRSELHLFLSKILALFLFPFCWFSCLGIEKEREEKEERRERKRVCV